MSHLSLVSFNARGLRNNVKRKALFLFAKQFRADFCFVQEAHSAKEDMKFWTSQWGNSVWFAHGSEHSAGVITLKNRFSGDVLHTECDPAGHFICQVIKYVDNIFILGNLYGYNHNLDNNNLFESIENIFISWLNKYPSAILLVGGDFNIILDGAIDKWPPGRPKVNNNNLKNFMDKFNLTDIWRDKFPHNK